MDCRVSCNAYSRSICLWVTLREDIHIELALSRIVPADTEVQGHAGVLFHWLNLLEPFKEPASKEISEGVNKDPQAQALSMKDPDTVCCPENVFVEQGIQCGRINGSGTNAGLY
jgi:hypothetical protein